MLTLSSKILFRPRPVAAMKKQRFTAADWEARIQAWERSGVEFGRRVGVSPGALYAWKHRLRRKHVTTAKPLAHHKAKFVEVEVISTERRRSDPTSEDKEPRMHLAGRFQSGYS